MEKLIDTSFDKRRDSAKNPDKAKKYKIAIDYMYNPFVQYFREKNSYSFYLFLLPRP